jgi:DNA repair protein SbcC/Rad50
MIPLQLHIKNFLSYGPQLQTIDFGSYPLICLSGKNGHGKSALLDAMTWALWGQARKVSGTTKPDQGLLHIGQTHMMVTFDFICNNIRYRVKREYTHTYGKPLTQLEFGSISPGMHTWSPCTDKTIRGTQEVIEKTLRLSYESFINSAFLRQGQSHEFSTKSPKERKEILASILGLQDYELVRKYAVEKAKKSLSEKQAIVMYQEKLHEELSKKQELATHYQEVVACLEKISSDIARLELTKNNLRTVLADHQTKLQKTFELKEHYLARKELLQRAEQQFRTTYQQKMAEQQASLQHLQLISHTHAITLQKFEQEALERQQELTLCTKELETIMYYLAHNKETGNHEQINQVEKQFEKRKNFYHTYRTQGMMLTEELATLRQKQALSHDEHNPSCPLCEQNLSASRKKFLHQKFKEQEQFFIHRISRFSRLVHSLKEILLLQHQELQQLRTLQEQYLHQATLKDEREKQQQKLVVECARIQESYNNVVRDGQATSKTLNALRQSIDRMNVMLEQELLHDSAYCHAQQSLQSINDELAAITYDQRLHEQTVQQLKTIEQQLTHYHEREQLLQRKGCLEQEIMRLTGIEKTLKEQQEAISRLERQADDYQIIAAATSKDGVPALLIEQALPEIEHEANNLLAKLTNNQAHIMIDSLRDLKKGGTKETLDIKISDAIGMRPYELFSGGEAFRIDFALRIAISKLLAHRAGTSLQTLIIDEGFGSQDEEGLAHIMDAIYKIQDDFAKVIIVSHLPSMKDNFPVHFFVEKRAQGSFVQIVEQA